MRILFFLAFNMWNRKPSTIIQCEYKLKQKFTQSFFCARDCGGALENCDKTSIAILATLEMS